MAKLTDTHTWWFHSYLSFQKNQHNSWSKNIFLKLKIFSLHQKCFPWRKSILCSYCVDMMMIKKLIYLFKRASNEIGVFPQSQYSPHVMPGENFMKTRWELSFYGCRSVESCVYKWKFWVPCAKSSAHISNVVQR